MTRVSEVIRGWLGWCPYRPGYSARESIQFPALATPSDARQEEGVLYKNSRMIIDCGSTAVSLPFFAGILIGALGIIAFLWLVVRQGLFPVSGALFLVLIFAVAVFSVLRDLSQEGMVVTPTALTILRPFNRPFVIPVETIESVQYKENRLPVPLWFQKITALFILP